eukprot:3261102-Prymnesium_polylepis.1
MPSHFRWAEVTRKYAQIHSSPRASGTSPMCNSRSSSPALGGWRSRPVLWSSQPVRCDPRDTRTHR